LIYRRLTHSESISEKMRTTGLWSSRQRGGTLDFNSSGIIQRSLFVFR